jgi:hypothetical protein
MGEQTATPKLTFTDRMRVIMKGIVTPIVVFLNKIGVTPNIVTILGLIGNIAAAALIGFGYVTYGGLMAWQAHVMDWMARLPGCAMRFPPGAPSSIPLLTGIPSCSYFWGFWSTIRPGVTVR